MKHTIKLSSENQIIRLPFEFCIVCGRSVDVVIRSFEQKEQNPVASFAKLAGDVSLIAEYILNKPHTVEAPFCRSCHNRFESVPSTRQMLHLLFVVVILISILTATYVHSISGINSSVLVFGIGIAVSIMFRVYARYYEWKNSPSIRKVNKNKMILKVRGRGKWVCHR